MSTVPVMTLPRSVLADATLLCEAAGHAGARPCATCRRIAVLLSGSHLRLAWERTSRGRTSLVAVTLGEHL